MNIVRLFNKCLKHVAEKFLPGPVDWNDEDEFS